MKACGRGEANTIGPSAGFAGASRSLRISAVLTLGCVFGLSLLTIHSFTSHLALDGRAVLFAATLMGVSFFLSSVG